jgi:acyl dehydratase
VFHDPPRRRFEDFVEGDVIITRGRTVDAADLTSFAGQTGDHYPLHTDEEYGRAGRFGGRIAHGPLTFAIAVGLVGLSNYYGDAIVALLEVGHLRAVAPVAPGDTVHVRAEVARCAAGDNPRYGTLEVVYSVRNQREEEVMNFVQVMLAKRQEPIGAGDG